MTYNKNDWESHDLITTGKMNNIEDGIQTALERATFGHGGAEMPSEGLHIESYINLGDPMPPNPLSGDIVYVKDGDDYIIYQYDGAMWVLQVNPKFAQRLQKNLLEAKAQTETLISENQVNVDKTINEVKEEQKNLQDGLNNLDTNAQDYANKALADARADIATTAQDLAEKVKQETDDRVKAVSDATAHADDIVSTAKSDLTNTIAKETSDRNAAVTALDTKAKGYADTAKADAIATANGAVAKEVTDRQKAITDLDAKSTGAINQAKTDAQSALNALQVGGRNLVIKDKLVTGWMGDGVVSSSTSAHAMTTDFVAVAPNSSLVAQIWYDNTQFDVTNNYLRVAFYDSNKTYITRTPLAGTGSTTYNKWLITTPANTAFVRVSFDWLGDGYGHAKLEIGNKATDYTQAPEDIVLDYTTKDNVIRQSLTQYQATNDGNVSKAQSDATQALGLVATKVSQTDYNTKTGDLDSKYTSVKQTVDTQTTDIADIKKTNTSQDAKLNTIQSDVNGTKQSISDIQTEQGKQSTKINTIQTDVSGTKQEISDIKDANGVQDGKIASISTTVDGLSSSFSTYKTTNDGKVAKAQADITANATAISQKVSQTAYDAKTGQLQTDLNTTTITANQAKTDIVAIKSDNTAQDARMTTIESDASGVKTTVSNLQSDLGKVSGSISTLQQRADGFDATVTKVNNLAVGGRNLLTNTAKDISVTSHTTNGYPAWANIDTGFSFENGKTYTFSSEAINSSDKVAEASIRVFELSTNTQVGIYAFPADGKRHSITFAIPNDSHKYKLLLYAGHAGIIPGVDVTTTYHHPKLESGNIATDWTPAPEDLEGATAKAQLTADNATTTINNYKTSNDGRVASAESKISQNATAITQKVSQTDYDQKTGQLQTDLNTTTNTANTAKQDIATIKTDNTTRDEKINTLESDSTETKRTISQLSGDLSTVSGDVSTLKQTAQGFESTVTKVNNMSVGGRNLVSGTNQEYTMGYGIPKTIWQDGYAFGTLPLASDAGEILPQAPHTFYYTLTQGTTYTQTIWIETDANVKDLNAVKITWFTGGGGHDYRQAIIQNLGQNIYKIVSTYTWPGKTSNNVRLFDIGSLGNGFDLTTGTYLKFGKLKLEQGNIATDWTPAPEDVDSSISSVKQTADSASTAITNYKVSNDGRVSAAEGNIKTNADAITQKVSIVDYDQKTGELSGKISEFNETAERITQSVTEVKGTLNDLQQVNLLYNTDFNPDSQSWKTNNDSGSISVNSYWKQGSSNNLRLVRNNGSTNWYYATQIIRSLTSNQTISFSVNAKVNTVYDGSLYIHVRAFKNDNTVISDLYKTSATSTSGTAKLFSSNGMKLPDGTAYIEVALGMYKNADVAFWRPIIVIGSTVGNYVRGQYSNNDKIALQQITIDAITNTVSDPTTGLSTRVQTAEGTISKVTGTDIPNLQKATFWQAPNGYDINTYLGQGSTFFRDTTERANAPTTSTKWMYLVVERTPNGDRVTQTAWYDTPTDAKITYRRQYDGSWGAWYANDNDSVTSIKQTNGAIQQEVRDRTNGDSNTLTQAKNFTTSSITSYDLGMQSQLTQTSDAIIAKISEIGVRYVRINGQGNQDNQGTHFMRVSLFDSSGKDLLLGKTATVSGPNSPYFGGNNGGNGATDGNVNTYNAIYPEPNANNFMVYDLGAVTYTSQKFEVKMWTNYRTYKGVTIQVSPDNKSWRTVLQEDVKSVSGDITKPDTTVNLGNTSSATQLALLKDNWSIGIAGNTGALASGIAGDANAMAVVSPKVIINSPQTQITGKLTAAQIDTKELSALSANLGNVSSGSITNPINQAWSAGTGATLLGTTVIDNRGINMNADIKTASNPKLYSETVSISPDTGIKFSWRDYTGGTVLPPVPLDMSMSSAGIVASSGKQYVSIVGNSITADNETAGTATTMSAMVSNPDGGINAGGAQSSAYIRYVTGQNDTQNLPLVMGLERIGNIVMVSFNFVTYGSTIRADAIQMNGPKIPVGFRPVDNVHIQAHANNGGTTIGTITFTITPDGKVLQTSPAINGIARIMGSATYLTYMIGAQAGFVVKDAQGNTTW